MPRRHPAYLILEKFVEDYPRSNSKILTHQDLDVWKTGSLLFLQCDACPLSESEDALSRLASNCKVTDNIDVCNIVVGSKSVYVLDNWTLYDPQEATIFLPI